MNSRTRTAKTDTAVAFVMLVVGALALPATLWAQQLHGAGITKSCTKVRRCSAHCSTTTSIMCVTDLNCPPGETCGLGDVCTGPTDCAAGSQKFCVGEVTNPGKGPHACSSVTDCRAASECSECFPALIPRAEVTAGETMNCEVVVSNEDNFTSEPQHELAVSSIIDTIAHATPRRFIVFSPGEAPSSPTATLSGECVPQTVVGGDIRSTRCSADAPCPAPQTCSLDLQCVDLDTNAVGGPCSSVPGAPPPSPGTPCSPPASGTCSVILPHGVGGLGGLDQVGSFVIADHTDVVVSGDAPTLFDDASAKGVDLDAMVPPAPFTVDTPGMIKVNVPPTPVGCRITGGGTVNGVLDPNVMAEITKAQFAGQVGAPCGCFGCFDKFDPKLASVQGEWKHQRKNKGGSLHANTFNSLVCSCLGGSVGDLCPDATPPRTPADHICITGIGTFIPDTGNGNKNPIPVAFRFEATDRGEPGNNDFYEMHIFTPAAGQTTEQLAQAICCTNPTSVLPVTGVVANDQGLLVAGNIQIHRALAKSTDGPCPPPRGVCMPVGP